MPSPARARWRATPEDPQAEVLRRRWLAAAAWAGGVMALFAFLFRISLAWPVNSDGANNALQGWDMLHGHLLLHGWILGDATFSTLELPLYAITEALFGLTAVVVHLVSALAYLIVAVLAVGLAVSDSHGAARAARAGVVTAVLAAVLTRSGVSIPLEQPDHTGTAAFLLVCLLLIDRAPGRRFTAPLLCLILCAGQIGDATVRYTAVPAIIIVCALRALAPGVMGGTISPVRYETGPSRPAMRTARMADAAIAIAAAVSFPLATLVRWAMLRAGGYVMLAPRTRLSPLRDWPRHTAVALQNIRYMFGAFTDPGAKLGLAGALFGLACLIAAVFGFGRVIWKWRAASRAEQLLCVAIVVTVDVYVVSTIPNVGNVRDIVQVLPCGAVLAARACVPARIAAPRRAGVAVAAAAAAALVPLTAAATRPAPVLQGASLATWLQAHDLRYGIAAYWDASDVTLVSDNTVQVRAVLSAGRTFAAYYWETEPSWYSAGQYDATFAIADIPPSVDGASTVADFERAFGRPASLYRVGGQEILVYHKNLLSQLVIPPAPRS